MRVGLFAMLERPLPTDASSCDWPAASCRVSLAGRPTHHFAGEHKLALEPSSGLQVIRARSGLTGREKLHPHKLLEG
jgi:hypothetical protein